MPSGFRVRVSGRLAVAALVLGPLVLGALGCRSGDRPIDVKGKVTFQGQPVTEGIVQFTDAKTGHGAEVELGADGSYQATVPAGGYTVVILPPMRIVESISGPSDVKIKKVRNIPEKYRSTASSGLTAAVSADATVHDFDLKP